MIIAESQIIIYNLNFRISKSLECKNINFKFHKIDNYLIFDKILNDKNPYIFDIN